MMNSCVKQYSPAGKYLSILLWPLLTLYFAVKDIRKPYGKNLLWLFVIFYGFIHIVFNEERGYVDGMSYAYQLENYYKSEITYEQVQSQFFSEDSKEVDYFMSYLCFFISRFTGDYRVLFIILATIYGFFFSRNIGMVTNRYKNRIVPFIAIMIVAFVFIMPPSLINGRIWIAVQMTLYGIFRCFLCDKKSGLIWCTLAPLVHFSTLIICGIILLYLILPKKTILFVAIVFASLFVTSLNLTSTSSFMTKYLPAYETKISTYASESYAEHRKETGFTSLFILIYQSLLNLMFRIALIIVFFTKRKIIENDRLFLRFFCFTALLSSGAAIMSLIPSGGRFLTISAMCTLVLFVLIANKTQNIIMPKFFQITFTVLLCYMIFYQIRTLLECVGFSILYSNPLIALLIEDNNPILYLIR